MIVINGQFPAPLIEANWGDWVEVTVKNSIQNPPEGTAIHWHALRQKETPWYDGVPGGRFPSHPNDEEKLSVVLTLESVAMSDRSGGDLYL